MGLKGMSAAGSERYSSYTDIINHALDKYKADELAGISEQKNIIDAMWYSLDAGGKRIRPVLAMEFCRLCGGSAEKSVTAGCALEMIHTFSLIHDDLPCMDDDNYRRGQLSCHAAHGEATALLAGDALENLAFGIICRDNALSDGVKVKLISALSEATGVKGMIGGQVIDTKYEGKPIGRKLLLEMYDMKTGALLKAACKMGCICAESDNPRLAAAEKYAENLGLAFQIIDDILDITGNSDELGKPVGSDAENGKITFASLVGIDEANKYAREYTDSALKALDIFGSEAEFMRELTSVLLKRKS